MDHKIVICHVCGVETKRSGDHIAAAHKLLDFSKERVHADDLNLHTELFMQSNINVL